MLNLCVIFSIVYLHFQSSFNPQIHSPFEVASRLYLVPSLFSQKAEEVVRPLQSPSNTTTMAVAVLLSAAVSLGSTLFLILRLVLYAVLVAAAWIGIIEGDPWGVGEPVSHVIELPPWEEADQLNVEKRGLKAAGEGVEATEEPGPLYGAGEEGGGAPSTGHGLTEAALQKHDRKEQAGRPRRRPHYTP